jgi:hypothetical protein
VVASCYSFVPCPREVNIVVQRLQGLTTLLSEQNQELAALYKVVSKMCDDGEAHDDDAVISKAEEAVAMKESRKHFIEDLEDTVADMYEGMTADEKARYLRSLGKVLVGSFDEIRTILSGSDDNPLQKERIPPVLPQELVKMRASDLLPFISVHRDRLVKRRGPQSVAKLQENFEAATYLQDRGQPTRMHWRS